MARRLLAVAVAAALLPLTTAAAPASAAGTSFAPVDTPGPALSVPAAQLQSRLTCSPGVDKAAKAPVLLVQGTGASAKDNWEWTYEPALNKLGIPWCTVDLPDNATADIQVAAEYIVYAIRTVSTRAARKVAIIGHSQGGMAPRWALRFWPDTRPLVDDVIGFAPSNHGTTLARDCSGGCSAAGWQQSDMSNFMRALNSPQETFKGISYTNVFTHTDEVVQPNMDAATGSSSLRTGDGAISNVATQDICPTDVYEHLLIGLVDPVAYALAVDALTHDGPADPERIAATVCAMPLHPGIDPVTGPLAGVAALQDYGSYKAKDVPKEPDLACYVTAACAATTRCVSTRHFVVHLPARFFTRVRATLNGKALRVVGRRVVVDLRGRPRGTVTLKLRGRTRAGRLATETRRYRTC